MRRPIAKHVREMVPLVKGAPFDKTVHDSQLKNKIIIEGIEPIVTGKQPSICVDKKFDKYSFNTLVHF